MRESTVLTFTIKSATLSAKQIQDALGLAPDETWALGDRRGAFGTREETHGFVLESKAPRHASVEEHIGTMLRRLEPYAEKIAALCPQSTIRLHCELHRSSGASLTVGRDDMRWLGVMGAKLDVDVVVARGSGPVASGSAAKEPEKG